MSNYLNRLLVVAVFCLPALGLTGCSYSRSDLGFLKNEKQPEHLAESELSTAKNQEKVEQGSSMADISVDMAGGIGSIAMGCLGGAAGGAMGAIGGGLYAAYNGTPIATGIAGGASGAARFVSSISAPVGKYALGMTTRGIIWVAPYAFNGLGWLASNAYGGIKYISSAIYNGIGSSQGLADVSSFIINEQLEQPIGLEDIPKRNEYPVAG